ncbi:hypothetical protein [Bradyrhizobium guangzhouense]|uniref:hypothetical protein n=1 Tax=Bradyrhizobium guangzhouense TaxID=1325095 RepID=UPI0010099BF7|nr:hypothetical protein [Bradyrhizobium guangzhouense]RXH10136.1 hypothetical protein EAS54_32320 [Bradyrhizobium guangzhouense]
MNANSHWWSDPCRANAQTGAPYQTAIRRKRRRWEWHVSNGSGALLAGGIAKSRGAARYESARLLFLLLLSSASQPQALMPHDRQRPRSTTGL